MAFSGKKGKKNKGTVISLQSFLSNGAIPVGTRQVAKNIRNIDGNDSDEGGNIMTVVCQLPTAPRANRIFDENSVPHKPPFISYITNLPLDVKEDDIYEYFNGNRVKSVRLPREDGDTGRIRGFGYVEFETRDNLVQALGKHDPTIKGSRIKIDLSNENDQNAKQRGSRRGFEAYSSYQDGRVSSNWRRSNIQKIESFGIDRSFNKGQKPTFEEQNSPGSWRLRNTSNITSSNTFAKTSDKETDNYTEDKNSISHERPKLILKPRTLPIPVFDASKHPDVCRQGILQKELIKTTQDLHELSITENQKPTSTQQSWRRQQPNDIAFKSKFQKNFGEDNLNKFQGETESQGYQKLFIRDGTPKDVKKNKPLQSFHNKYESLSRSSNKYSGLDETSD